MIGRCFKILSELVGKSVIFSFLVSKPWNSYKLTIIIRKNKGLFQKSGLLFLSWAAKKEYFEFRAEEFFHCCCPLHRRWRQKQVWGLAGQAEAQERLQLQQDVASDLVGRGCSSASAAQEPQHPCTPQHAELPPSPSPGRAHILASGMWGIECKRTSVFYQYLQLG